MRTQDRTLRNSLIDACAEGVESVKVQVCTEGRWTYISPENDGVQAGFRVFSKKGISPVEPDVDRLERDVLQAWELAKETMPDVSHIRLWFFKETEQNGRTKSEQLGSWSCKRETLDGRSTAKTDERDLSDVLLDPDVTPEQKEVVKDIYAAKVRATVHPDARSFNLMEKAAVIQGKVIDQQQERIKFLEKNLFDTQAETIRQEREARIRAEQQVERLNAELRAKSSQGSTEGLLNALAQVGNTPSGVMVAGALIDGMAKVISGDVKGVGEALKEGKNSALEMVMPKPQGDSK